MAEFITCSLNGRLGNQMFMIANAYSHAIDNNRKLILPRNNLHYKEYTYNIYRKLEFTVDNIEDIEGITEWESINPHFTYTPITISKDKNTVFHGWYQSEKFFKHNGNAVKKLFGITKEFTKKCYQEYPQLKDNNATFISVRRGDYLCYPDHHPVVSLEYIYKAFEVIPKEGHKNVFITSDDVEWCKDNIKIKNAIFITNSSYEAIWFMSLCKHFIISNSTFSWWGAYLGEKENSVTVAPNTWFGPAINEDTRDIYKENWIKLPTYCEGGFIYPK
jgi:hypothetical protein